MVVICDVDDIAGCLNPDFKDLKDGRMGMYIPPFRVDERGQGVCGRRGAGARWRERASYPCRFTAHPTPRIPRSLRFACSRPFRFTKGAILDFIQLLKNL